jgi:hypothetical protein
MSGTIADWEREAFSARTADEIDALPETEEPPVTTGLNAPAHTVLMDRSSGGWATELRLQADGTVVIAARQGFDGKFATAVIDGANALDAFDHPYCYLPV